MSEIKTKLTPYNINYQCDNCIIALMSLDPVQEKGSFNYTCTNCNYTMNSNLSYPYIKYE